MRKTVFLITFIFACIITLATGGYAQNQTAPQDPKLQWFTDARFGMFIHFGLYSIPGGVWEGRVSGRNMYAEWIQKQGNWPTGLNDKDYQALTKQFNPTKFNAEEWALEAKNAGMKYIVITSKHHDGFALWPSKVSKYDVVDATPFKRDILGELAKACKKHDLKLGFYYSHWQDWEHPGGAKPPLEEFKSIPPPVQVSHEQFEEYWQKKCLPQVLELIENYHPALMWFDTWGKPEIITDKRLDELIATVRKADPNCLINSRILMKHPEIADKVDFLSMGDNSFPTESIAKPWETSGTLNHSFGYHRLDYDWEPAQGLLRKLVGNVSRNGNFQLNVGPMPNGTFPKATVRRLREIGAWLAVNGEAVYATKSNPFGNVDWGYITCKPTANNAFKIYLHVTQWPKDGNLSFPALPQMPKRITLLETGQELDYRPHHNITVKLPQTPPDEKITVVVVEGEGGF